VAGDGLALGAGEAFLAEDVVAGAAGLAGVAGLAAVAGVAAVLCALCFLAVAAGLAGVAGLAAGVSAKATIGIAATARISMSFFMSLIPLLRVDDYIGNPPASRSKWVQMTILI